MVSRIAIGAALLATLAFPLAAQEHVWPLHGGTGGTAFDLTCGDDAVLVGVSGRAGQWVDQLTARCVKVKNTGEWSGTVFTRGPRGGTGGNAIAAQDCPAGSAVAGISGRHGWYLHSLRLSCYDLGADAVISGSATRTLDFGVGGGDTSWSWETCPGNKPGKGFRGRAGGFLDAISFICHSGSGFPRTIAPPATVTAAPVLIAPVDLATLSPTGLRPTFQWAAAGAARRYQLCARRPGSSACDVLNVSVTQAFSGTTPLPIVSFRPATDLQFGTVAQINWTVTGCNDVGCGPWAPARRLNAPPPPAPAVSFATLTPTFRHARCQNCHNVVASNFAIPGTPGLPAGHPSVSAGSNVASTCRTCHTTAMLPAQGIDPGWHGAPAAITFAGRTDLELCNQVRAMGTGSVVQQHLSQDKLVLWAVGDGRRPGNATPLPLAPPGSIASWQTLVANWVNAGMACN